MVNIKYAIKRIINQPYVYSFMLVETILSLVLILLSISSIYQIASSLQQSETFLSKRDFSLVTDQMDYNTFKARIEDEENSDIGLMIFNEINHNQNFKSYLFYPSSINLPMVKEYPVFLEDSIDIFLINENVNEFNQFSLYKGSYFSAEDFHKDNKVVPIIMGENLEEIFTVNEVFESDGVHFKVIGFLESGEEFNGHVTGNRTPLDYKAIVPFEPFYFQMLHPSLSTYAQNLTLVSSLSNVGIYEISSNTSLDSIKEKIDTHAVTDIEFISKRQEFKEYYDTQIELVSGYIILFSTSIIFAMIGIVSSLSSYITRNKKELAVHLLNGASIRDLQKTLLYQIFLTNIIAWVFSNLIFSGISGQVDYKLISYSFLIVVVYCIIILINPYRLLQKIDFIGILGGKKR